MPRKKTSSFRVGVKSRAGLETSARFTAVFLLLFLAVGCAVGPDYIKPSAPEPTEWLQGKDPKIASKPADFDKWWTVFNDPTLNSLVESAYNQNLPLRIAGIRILEARAQLGIAVGFQYPQTQQASGEATANQLAHNAPNAAASDAYFLNYQVGFDAAWELDFWGKFRRAVESGTGSLEASIADYDDILVALTAEAARTYVAIRTAEERLTIAGENVKIQQRSLEIAEARFKGGAVTELDVTQARSLLRDTQSRVPQLQSDLRQAKNALATLLGKLPGEVDAMLTGPQLIPTVPAEVAVGIPAELLRRRPDIRLAERQIAAQTPLVGVAKADLYPQFALFGSIGLQASDKVDRRSNNSSLSNLFESDSITYFVGPTFQWPILNYGRIKNRVRVQDARLQQLVVNYKDTVIRAAQEVEDAMVAFLRFQDAVSFLTDAVNSSKRSVDLSMIQYREGLADYQRVLDAQRFLSDEQDRQTATRGFVVTSLIGMYKALGGGWQIREGKDFVPEETREEMASRTDWGYLLSPEKLETRPAEESGQVWYWPDW